MTNTWHDPVTGDSMSLSDRASWIAQGIIRRWTFVLVNVVLSITWWLSPGWFGDDGSLTHWMALYSLLAVVIESIVGIGMFSQTRRDAVILREVRSLVSDVKLLVEREEQEIHYLEEDLGSR